ncbi:MAG: hypothetical protein B7733_18910 [Myxococcales bacterium FL481]|nr:MAG: hypothetical protein B7733_18910 [Myxococcales bacterium FL481]
MGTAGSPRSLEETCPSCLTSFVGDPNPGRARCGLLPHHGRPMNKYLFLYRNPPAPDRQPSPEEMQQMMAQWEQWKTKFKDHVHDMGDGLQHTGRVLESSGVTDGPFAESKEIVGGFSIVVAESYDDALRVARECPITFMPGYNIEVRQMMGY